MAFQMSNPLAALVMDVIKVYHPPVISHFKLICLFKSIPFLKCSSYLLIYSHSSTVCRGAYCLSEMCFPFPASPDGVMVSKCSLFFIKSHHFVYSFTINSSHL